MLPLNTLSTSIKLAVTITVLPKLDDDDHSLRYVILDRLVQLSPDEVLHYLKNIDEEPPASWPAIGVSALIAVAGLREHQDAFEKFGISENKFLSKAGSLMISAIAKAYDLDHDLVGKMYMADLNAVHNL